MGFHPQEVETAVRNGLRVVFLVLCDKQWGMVKMNQQFMLKPIKTLIRKSLGPDETIKADLGEIRFDELARAMGAHGERVADPRETQGRDRTLDRERRPGGDPRRRRPGEAHVGARPDALQGHAPGAEGEMTEIDAVRLNFSPESLVALNFILAFVMFGVALDMKPADFKGITAAPRAVLIGMVAQFLLLPAAAWALTMVLRPQPSIALGMILVACCPGGNISNFLTHFARGNTALSVTMTAFSTVGALFFTPFNTALWGSLNPATDAILREIAIDPVEMFVAVAILLVVPALLGMGVAHRFPGSRRARASRSASCRSACSSRS